MGTARDITVPSLAWWAQRKGIHLLASADFTHPVWRAHLRESLQPAPGDLFVFGDTHFMLGTELSCVFRHAGKSRRMHLLVYVPSFATVERICQFLECIGVKLAGDGRPMISLHARALAAAILEIEPRSIIIPAHAWTPWYALFGSKSGFDSLDECFGDLAADIPALETGLSSDPAMNWRVPDADGRSIVSFSDAHSLRNLGRECTAFQGLLTFDGLAAALREERIAYTLEYHPEEGKYHATGHRACDVRYLPEDSRAHGTICPSCGRTLTVGVLERVEALATRPEFSLRADEQGFWHGPDSRPPFKHLVPLAQILAEALGVGPQTKTVANAYMKLTGAFGSEFAVLLEAGMAEVANVAGERIAAGIARMRSGDLVVEPGFDGRYGTVRIWPE
jgi:uncharacterized protein (TIGR00375 family)